MAEIVSLTTFNQQRGDLTVIEKVVPFDIKRVFYIYNVDDSVRGKHRHKRTVQAAVVLNGECTIYCNNGVSEDEFHLHSPNECLVIHPEDWHTMYNFSENAILLVLA